MRILHLVNHCIYGNGSVHVAVDLACGQAQLGHEVMYASAGGQYLELMSKQGVICEHLVQRELKPVALTRSLFRLIQICRTFKPEIIHAHMMAGAAFGKLVSVLFRIPLVTTVHNSFDRHSLIMRLGNKVVAVSNAERELLIKRGFNPQKVVAILNGPNFSPRDSHTQPAGSEVLDQIRSPCVMTLCGLHRRKGVHDLIAGFAEIAHEHPTWNLYVVGYGPDRDELEKLRAQLKLENRVTFLGYINIPGPALKKADIFVLASYADPCALVIPEAREAGCAIIGTAVGGTPELLEHGKAGILVNPEAPKEIASALDLLMSDPAMLQRFRASSKQGSEYYRVSRVVEDYCKVYTSLTSSPVQ
jgi:glycosyltransferase involved in cell wall biosynthesis